MYCSRYIMVLVFMSLALKGHSAPITRRSRAKTLPSEEASTSTEKSEEVAKDESTTTAPTVPNSRKNKALNLFNYYPSFLPAGLDYNDDDDDDVTFGISDDGIDEEDLSRTIPSKRKLVNKKKNGNRYENDNLNSLQYDNSPMFFIRLPPTPYMFIPGLGYISQPPSLGPPMGPPMPQPQVNDPFINLPVDFVSNGKPIGVYEWNGAPNYPQVPQMQVDPYGYGPQPIMPPARPTYTPSYSKPKPKPGPTSSKVTNLKGQYVFNGKPSDSVYVLRDTYNSIYSDALQNFYP